MTEYHIVELERSPEDARASRGHLFLGITDKGLAFCDSDKNELKMFLYTDISSWAATKTNFAFTHGTFESVGKFVFRTEKVSPPHVAAARMIETGDFQSSEISDQVRAKVNTAYANLMQ